MLRTEADLLAAGCTQEELTKIKQQYRGGVSGARGSQYEDVYATWRLLRAMKVYLVTGLEASVQRQALMPVDDVIYFDDDKEEYCQLKTSPDVTWTAEQGKLERQFLLQQRLCQNAPEPKPFILRLVTPNEKRKRLLEDSLPDSLATETEIVTFESFETLKELWMEGGHCYNLLRDLCAFGPDSPSRREAIFFVFFDVIQKGRAGSPVALAQVIEEVEKQKPSSVLRLRNYEIPKSWLEATIVLNNIHNLTVDIIGGICHYVYEDVFLEEGVIGRTGTGQLERFLDRVIEYEPETFDDFEVLL